MRLLNRSSRAFTLIELLIVVAIIGILAAIAVPNFLNAQTRAKAARSFSDLNMLAKQNEIRYTDTNLWIIDGNDCDNLIPEKSCLPGGSTPQFFGLGCANAPGRICLGIDDKHFNGHVWALLTTPTSYIGGIPVDPFGAGMFYGYNDIFCSNGPEAHLWMIFAAGPDGDRGEFGTPYNPSNGVSSDGDIWRMRSLRDDQYTAGYRGREVVIF